MVAREGDIWLTEGEPVSGEALGPSLHQKKEPVSGDTPSALGVALKGSKMLCIRYPEHRPHGLARGYQHVALTGYHPDGSLRSFAS